MTKWLVEGGIVQEEKKLAYCSALARLRNSSWVREVIVQEKRHVGEALPGSWLRRSLWVGRGKPPYVSPRGWGLASGWPGVGGETLPAQVRGRYLLHSWPWLEQVHGWSTNLGVVQK